MSDMKEGELGVLEMDLQMGMAFQLMPAFMVFVLIFFPLIFVLLRIL